MSKNKLLLKEEADDEIKFVDDDVFYSDEPVQVDLPPVEPDLPPVVEPEVIHNAYNDIMQDLLKKQWDVINACDGIVATLSTEENITFDKEAVTSILKTLADDITASIGMTTKAMSVVDPTQDELMKEGERKADDMINASEKEVVDGDLEEDTRAEKNLEAVPLSTYVNKWSKYSRYGIPNHAREVTKDEFEDELKDKPDALRIVREFFDEHPKAYSCIIKYYYNKYKDDEGDTIHYVVSDNKSNLYTYLKDAIRDIESGRFGTGRTIIYEIPNDYEKEYGDDMSHLGNEDIVAEFENCKPIKEELLGEATDVWGLFAIEIDPKTGRKIADVEGGKAIETGSKEELQPKVREYESSWNVNPQGKTYRFHLKRLTSESVNEDMVNELEVDDLTDKVAAAEVVLPDDVIPETFEEQMDYLAADEQEAIDGYDRIIELVEDEHVKEQLMKIKTEEIAHKEFLEKVKEDRGLEYTEPLEPEKVEEDIETVYAMNTENWHGFDNLDWYHQYWAWEALSHIESVLENADDDVLEDGESDEFILNNLDEESLKDLCIDIARHIGNYDYLWETMWECVGNCLSDRISKGKYDDRINNYVSIQTGENNNPEGENN